MKLRAFHPWLWGWLGGAGMVAHATLAYFPGTLPGLRPRAGTSFHVGDPTLDHPGRVKRVYPQQEELPLDSVGRIKKRDHHAARGVCGGVRLAEIQAVAFSGSEICDHVATGRDQ